MPSKEFLEKQNIPMGPPDGGMPDGMPVIPGPMASMMGGNIPEEYAHLNIPMVSPDYVPPDPVIPEGFTGGKVVVGGVPGLHLTKEGLRDDAVMMYIHGGGWTIGSAMQTDNVLAHFANEAKLEGYSVEYRLAPYHKFPAAVDDCVDFYCGLLEMGHKRIVVGGESAGAGLTLSLVHALKAKGLPLPAALWCSSPPEGFDTGTVPFIQDQFTGCNDDIIEAYAGDADLHDPRLSPIFGDFTDFPPMFIQVGGGESLAAGGINLALAAMKCNNEVILHCGKDMPHTFAMDAIPGGGIGGSYPEAVNAMKEFVTFITNTLDIE